MTLFFFFTKATLKLFVYYFYDMKYIKLSHNRRITQKYLRYCKEKNRKNSSKDANGKRHLICEIRTAFYVYFINFLKKNLSLCLLGSK